MKIALFAIITTLVFGSSDLVLKLPGQKINKNKKTIRLTVVNNNDDTLYYYISLLVH